MVHPVQVGKRTRMSFGKVPDATEIPNLIEVQLNSYKWFLDEKAGKHFSLKRAVKKNCPEPMLNMLRQAKNLIAKR